MVKFHARIRHSCCNTIKGVLRMCKLSWCIKQGFVDLRRVILPLHRLSFQFHSSWKHQDQVFGIRDLQMSVNRSLVRISQLTSAMTSFTGTAACTLVERTHSSRSVIAPGAENIGRCVANAALTECCYKSRCRRGLILHCLLEQIAA